jgi:hypothetical protein
MAPPMIEPMTVRDEMLRRAEEDLVNEVDTREVLSERPSDRYLLGILFPPGDEVERSEDDAPREEPARPTVEGPGEMADVPIYRAMRPSSFGLSFRVTGASPRVAIRLTGGRYGRDEAPRGGAETWRREPIEVQTILALEDGFQVAQLSTPLSLSIARRVVAVDGGHAVTIVVSNLATEPGGAVWAEEHSLFQARLTIQPVGDTMIVPRPFTSSPMEDEDRSAKLLYRRVREYAVGHTCSASWSVDDDAGVSISTAWLPRVRVPAISAAGSRQFQDWVSSDAPSAGGLADSSDDQLASSLAGLSAAYRRWIDDQEAGRSELEGDDLATADRHLAECRLAADAIDEGIRLVETDAVARRAFRLANRAMVMQLDASTKLGRRELRWRPFQLAFQLACLPSIADPAHPGRAVMDLLWFPTGGGKTEAYLGLIAFLVLHRRLRHSHGDDGAGVAAIMRYTLRVLTAQQFQRAAAMIAACEEIRMGDPDLGAISFSIGLWIGGDGTPNTLAQAADRPADVKILTACPRCGGDLTNPTATQRRQSCRNESCVFHDRPVPVHVVDDDVYEARPSLLLATVDKFAQITRQTRSRALFSLDRRFPPPDLILQDELHLISGPLGTISGLYEIAIDQFCSWAGSRPKIIGSTATIRRAREQVGALFDRGVRTFPPPGLDSDDSGFAVDLPDSAGRLYVGVPTTGRSPKFALQALLASLAQSPLALAASAAEADIDPFWTCVGYFNSIRELGGAVVLVEDDVRRSIERLAARRGERARTLDIPSEVTSRVPTREIPELLARLDRSYPAADIDVVLASNMISVGVDVPRLGLMVVNGQPKTTAEYIQATSRVGRQTVPGLIVVLYNVARPRDRSRYESFETWHRALYRDVEPTSVTPFAARARDRALHAPLVALLRLLDPPAGDSPLLGPSRMKAADAAIEVIVARAGRTDPDEQVATRAQLRRLVDEWAGNDRLRDWWWSRGHEQALMIGAEDQAGLAAVNRRADAWSTPNSMRDVEPTTRFRVVPSLARRSEAE